MPNYQVTAQAVDSDKEYVYEVEAVSPQRAAMDAYARQGQLYAMGEVDDLLGPFNEIVELSVKES